MDLYEKIKELAAQKNISIRQLEEKLGFANATLRRWNKNKPSVDKIQAVAKYFNVSVDYLLGNDGDYNFDNYPFKVSVTQNIDGTFKIITSPLKDTPVELIQTINEVKSSIEKMYNTMPDFNTKDTIWTTNHIEEKFLEELTKSKVWITRLKTETQFSPELDEAIEHAEAYEGTPLTDQDKAILRGVISAYLENRDKK